MYNSAHKLLEVCKEENITICEATLRHEEKENNLSRETIRESYHKMYDVMKDASSKAINETVITMSGITGGNAKKQIGRASCRERV